MSPTLNTKSTSNTKSTWNTKYGTRRVRHDPPTLDEAIAAAQGLTDDVAGQIEIAADLMGVPAAEVKSAMAKLNPDKRATRIVTTPSRDNGARTVVVERKASRRVIARQDGAKPETERPAPIPFKVTLSPRRQA